VTKYSKRLEFIAPSTSAKTERNRVMLWESTSQALTKSFAATPSPKTSIILSPIEFVSKVAKSLLFSIGRLPYKFFKLLYEIAKFVARGLSSIRHFLFVAK